MSREALSRAARVRGLDPTERAVLHEIAAREQRNDLGRAWKVEDLAELVGRQRRVVAAVLRDLERLGMVRRWARPGCAARYAVELEGPPVVFSVGPRGRREHDPRAGLGDEGQSEMVLAVQDDAPLQRPLQGSGEPLQPIAGGAATHCRGGCNPLQPCPPPKFTKFSKCADARAGPEDRGQLVRLLPEAEAFLARHRGRRR